jgi:hypothetical protein
MTREVLHQALEAYIKAGNGNSTDFYLQGMAYGLGIEALAKQDAEAHLQAVSDFEQLQEQEPVAYMYPVDLKKFETSECHATAFSISCGSPTFGTTVPLYAAPPKRQPEDFDSWYESPYSKRLMKSIKVTKMLAVDDRLFALQIPEAEIYKREWMGLTGEEIINMSCGDLHYAALIGDVVRKLKERNT